MNGTLGWLTRCNGPRNICLIATLSSWSARCGRKHWAGRGVEISQTWGEVHRVNSRVRDALKGKGLLGAADATVQTLERIDLTNAQKRDARFYPPEGIVVFNQRVRGAQPGTKGKLAGIVKAGVLIDVGGRFVTVPNKLLNRMTLCQTREVNLASGDRLQLKANRKLVSGGRVTNGELVTMKSVRADGGVELTDEIGRAHV